MIKYSLVACLTRITAKVFLHSIIKINKYIYIYMPIKHDNGKRKAKGK
jgi:hypothetical protein